MSSKVSENTRANLSIDARSSVVLTPTPPIHRFSFVPMANSAIGVPSIFFAGFRVYPALVNISLISGYSITALRDGATGVDGVGMFNCGGGVCGNAPNGMFNRGGRAEEGAEVAGAGDATGGLCIGFVTIGVGVGRICGVGCATGAGTGVGLGAACSVATVGAGVVAVCGADIDCNLNLRKRGRTSKYRPAIAMMTVIISDV